MGWLTFGGKWGNVWLSATGRCRVNIEKKEKVMKINLYLLVAVACVLMCGCGNAGKSKNELLGDFARSVLKAGKEKDFKTFVNKLSMSSIADYNAIIEVARKANPEAKPAESEEKVTDEALRKEAEDNVRLFMNSYEGMFDGELSSVITVSDPTIKAVGVDTCSMIIWSKQKDGKFRGIKISSAWKKNDGTFKVITWVQLSGYEASKNAIKKKAILERDTVKACDYPEWIKYETVFTQ